MLARFGVSCMCYFMQTTARYCRSGSTPSAGISMLAVFQLDRLNIEGLSADANTAWSDKRHTTKRDTRSR